MAEKNIEKQVSADWALVVVVALTVTLYLASNLMSVRIINWGWLSMDAGTLTFPCVFLMENVITEVWGFHTARRVIFLVFVCNVLMMSVTSMVILFPAPLFQQQFTVAAYRHVFLSVPRLIAASLIAFLGGGLCNAWTMAKIRKLTSGRHLWMRTIGSSMLGYLLDSVLFSTIAFAFTTTGKALLSIILVQFTLKISMEIFMLTPVAYGLVAILKKYHESLTSALIRELHG